MSKNPFPEGRWADAMTAAGWQCEADAYQLGSTRPCDRDLIVHHKRLRAMGGTSDPTIHDLANLAVLCGRHHDEVHSYPARSYDCGLLIRR